MEYQPRALAVGEKVYLESSGWHGASYRVGTVDKITPTGRIVINGDAYRPDGRKLGNLYGERIDWMPFANRAARVARANRLLEAGKVFNSMLDTTPLRSYDRDDIAGRLAGALASLRLVEAKLAEYDALPAE